VPRPRIVHPSITRGALLFCLGAAILIHQTFFAQTPNALLIVASLTCLGLPIGLQRDGKL
jgi:hypothetical protein